MRFLDANVVIHALYQPKRRLNSRELEIKARAANLLARIEAGERVLTSAVHVSEIANFFEARNPSAAREIVKSVLLHPNISIEPVDKESYLLAMEYSHENDVGLNDGLALLIMNRRNLNQILSFDGDFDGIPDVVRSES
jgi:hypothetical protein